MSNFAREEEAARRRLLDEKDKQMSMASWDIDNYLKQTISPHPQSLFEINDMKQKSVACEPTEHLDQNLDDTARQLMDFDKQSSINTDSVHKLPMLKLKIVGESDQTDRPQTKCEDMSPISFNMKLNTKNVSPKRAPQHRYLDPTYSSSSRNYQTRFDKT